MRINRPNPHVEHQCRTDYFHGEPAFSGTQIQWRGYQSAGWVMSNQQAWIHRKGSGNHSHVGFYHPKDSSNVVWPVGFDIVIPQCSGRFGKYRLPKINESPSLCWVLCVVARGSGFEQPVAFGRNPSWYDFRNIGEAGAVQTLFRFVGTSSPSKFFLATGTGMTQITTSATHRLTITGNTGNPKGFSPINLQVWCLLIAALRFLARNDIHTF